MHPTTRLEAIMAGARQRPVAWVFAVTATLLVVRVIAAEWLIADDGVGALSAVNWSIPCFSAAAAAIIWWRVVRIPADRLGWSLIGVAVSLFSIGDSLSVALTGTYAAPDPGPADILWLAYYPALYTGIVVLALGRQKQMRRSAVLDGLIVAAGFALIGVSLLAGVLTSAGGSLTDSAAKIAYPLGDLSLLAIALGMLVAIGGRPSRRWCLIAGSFVVLVGAEAAYGVMETSGSWGAVGAVDGLWSLALLMQAGAAWIVDAPGQGRVRWLDGTRILLPTVFAIIALAVLGAAVAGHDTSVPAAGLALATLLLSVWRMATSSRENARLARELRVALEDAATDPLTGLGNHRAFHEQLRARAEAAWPSGESLALVMIDIDGFKRVNDIHGHQAGDAVLTEVARRLEAVSREDDPIAVPMPRDSTLARVGGEEFAWAFPGADAAGARSAAERLRTAIAEVPFDGVGVITVSCGVCELSASGGNASELYRLADGALYWAKRQGRNRTVVYNPEVIVHTSAEEQAHAKSLAAIRALADAVDARDHRTSEHSERVASLAAAIACEIGWSDEEVARLRDAGRVHDVGKIGIPDAVLLKPGALTDEEFDQVKAHAALGAAIVADVCDPEQVSWVRHHHERIDGAGYPDGVAGDAIPEGARIMAVADAFDAMTADRVYRGALSRQKALSILEDGAGRQWDHEAVAAILALETTGRLSDIATEGTRARARGCVRERVGARSSDRCQPVRAGT